MSATFCRPIHVYAYRRFAGTIEPHGRWFVAYDHTGAYLGVRSTRKGAAHVLEENMLRTLYRRDDGGAGD
jgi:hypothetical protein